MSKSSQRRARRMSNREAADASAGGIVVANNSRGTVESYSFGDPEPAQTA